MAGAAGQPEAEHRWRDVVAAGYPSAMELNWWRRGHNFAFCFVDDNGVRCVLFCFFSSVSFYFYTGSSFFFRYASVFFCFSLFSLSFFS